LKYGEVASRIIIVGDPNRAKMLSGMLDGGKAIYTHESARGFVTYTGRFEGLPFTVMAIGMGMSMADFMVRETRHITKGPLGIIRLGTCGTPRSDVQIGALAVAKKSCAVTTNYDAFISPPLPATGARSASFYHLSKPIPADPALHANLMEALKKHVTGTRGVVECGDATCDSFYSSQGRTDPNFGDRNQTLVDDIVAHDSNIGSIQMETFQLFHLARLSGRIATAACAIVLAQRRSNDFLSHDEKHRLEKEGGKACFYALKDWVSSGHDVMDDDPVCVWNKTPPISKSGDSV